MSADPVPMDLEDLVDLGENRWADPETGTIYDLSAPAPDGPTEKQAIGWAAALAHVEADKAAVLRRHKIMVERADAYRDRELHRLEGPERWFRHALERFTRLAIHPASKRRSIDLDFGTVSLRKPSTAGRVEVTDQAAWQAWANENADHRSVRIKLAPDAAAIKDLERRDTDVSGVAEVVVGGEPIPGVVVVVETAETFGWKAAQS